MMWAQFVDAWYSVLDDAILEKKLARAKHRRDE